MEALTLKDLRSACEAIIDNCPRDYPELSQYFSTAYTFGLRPVEIYELKRWKFINEKDIQIETAKGSNPRIIYSGDVLPAVIEKILAGVEYWEMCRYNSMRLYCQRFSPYPFAKCLSKEISIYIFRHTYIKNLSELGLKDEDIAKIMGEVDVRNITGYVKSEIYPS